MQAPGPPAITERGAEAIKTGATLRPPRSRRRRAIKAACLLSGAPLSGEETGWFGWWFMMAQFYRPPSWTQVLSIPRSMGLSRLKSSLHSYAIAPLLARLWENGPEFNRGRYRQR